MCIQKSGKALPMPSRKSVKSYGIFNITNFQIYEKKSQV